MSEKLDTIQYILGGNRDCYTIRRLGILSRAKITKSVRGIAWFSRNADGEPVVIVDQAEFYPNLERFMPLMAEASDRTIDELEHLDLVELLGVFGAVVELNLLSVKSLAEAV